MTRWAQGEADINALLAKGHLQRVTGARADGQAWVDRAIKTLATARTVVDVDPSNAFTLAYDAVRYACTGLLVHQGLRPTVKGGHLAVEAAARAQFGQTFRPYRSLRRRRNELEYPSHPDELADATEAQTALDDAEALIEAAAKLLPRLGSFHR